MCWSIHLKIDSVEVAELERMAHTQREITQTRTGKIVKRAMIETINGMQKVNMEK